MIAHAGTPAEEHVPPEFLDKIIHARLNVGGAILMGCDAPADQYEAPEGFSVHIGIKDQLEAERIFHALAENGTVRMPIQKTFWAARLGMLVDQFGIPWMVNCE